MSKLKSHLSKLATLCYRHKFLIERSLDTTQGTHSYFEYGALGAEFRRNLKNLWWQEVVTSRESVQGLEISNCTTDGLSCLESISTQQHRMIDVEYFTEKLSALLQGGSKEMKDVKFELRKTILQNSIPLRTTCNFLNNFENYTCDSQPAMPAGYAWHTKQFSMEPDKVDSFKINLENQLLCLQFLCKARSSKYWFNFWRRQQIVWWRNLANDPSNFSSFDAPKTNDGKVITKNQYTFSWGNEEIESITCLSNGSSLNEMDRSNDSNPSTILISTNIDKGFIALLADAFEIKDRADMTGEASTRSVLHLHPSLAPYKVAIHTSLTERNELAEVSKQLASELRQAGISTSSERMIGQSAEQFYTHQDEIGTPYCVTILQSTLSNGVVAFRNRDTTLQEFLHISDVLKTLQSHLKF